MARLQFAPDKIAAIEAVLADAWKNRASVQAQAEAEARAEEESSASRAFLLEFRARRGETLQPVVLYHAEDENGDTDSENTHLGGKTLSAEEFFEVGVLMASGGYTLHDLTNAGAQVLFYSALFHVGVVRGDDENARYFETLDAAREWLREPGFIEVPLLLRQVLFEMNPLLKKVAAPDGLELLIQSGAFSSL